METQEKIKKAIEQGDYGEIWEELKKTGLLEEQTAQLREKYAERLRTRGFEPEQKIWEMMAIEDLYDAPTLNHSVRTFELVDDMITKTLNGPRGEKLLLQTLMEEAGVNLRDIRTAAIGHDIGKLKIPLPVLHNKLSDEDMNRVLLDMIHRGARKKEIFERIGFDENETKSDEEILSRLYDKGLRAVNVVPLSEAFPEEKHPGFSEALEKRGFSPEQTIKQVAVAHESAGQKIFEDMNEPIVADLVGHHHNYQKEPDSEIKYKIKIPALHTAGSNDEFGVYNILKIADELDSLQSSRPYKKAMTRISALAELTHQADAGRLEKRLLYLWIDNNFKELKEKIANGTIEIRYEEVEEKSIARIEEFLKETGKIFLA
jgi:hypothetical protein